MIQASTGTVPMIRAHAYAELLNPNPYFYMTLAPSDMPRTLAALQPEHNTSAAMSWSSKLTECTPSTLSGYCNTMYSWNCKPAQHVIEQQGQAHRVSRNQMRNECHIDFRHVHGEQQLV